MDFSTANLGSGIPAEVGLGSVIHKLHSKGCLHPWMAEQVGTSGSVSAVDSSLTQLRPAERSARGAGLTNISFRLASAHDSGLPHDSFDMVCSRFLLCRLTRLAGALKGMRSLLKKRGLLVCEDYDMSSVVTDPLHPPLCRSRKQAGPPSGPD